MRNKSFTYRWMLTAWIMLWSCMSSVWAYDPYSPSSAPTYEFRSTSYFVSQKVNTPSFTPLADDPYAGIAKVGGVRRDGNPWDLDNPGENDNPIGQVDEPTPIGTPLVMLLMALMYIAFRVYRRKQA